MAIVDDKRAPVLRAVARFGEAIGRWWARRAMAPASRWRDPVPGWLVAFSLSGVSGFFIAAAVWGFDPGKIFHVILGLAALLLLFAPFWVLAIAILAGVLNCLFGRR